MNNLPTGYAVVQEDRVRTLYGGGRAIDYHSGRDEGARRVASFLPEAPAQTIVQVARLDVAHRKGDRFSGQLLAAMFPAPTCGKHTERRSE